MTTPRTALARLIRESRSVPRAAADGAEIHVDLETHRLLGNMIAVGLQFVLMLLSLWIAAGSFSPVRGALVAGGICVAALARLRRRPFERMAPPASDAPADLDYWRSTRALFRAGQWGLIGLGAVLLVLIEHHAGRPTADLAYRVAMQIGLATLFAFGYAVR